MKLAHVLLFGGVVTAGPAGCGTSEKYCDCVRYLDQIRIEAAPNEVSSITANGPGCPSDAGAFPDGLNGFLVLATGEGNCHVDIVFSNGAPRYSVDVHVLRQGDDPHCCAGFLGAVLTPDDTPPVPDAGLLTLPGFDGSE